MNTSSLPPRRWSMRSVLVACVCLAGASAEVVYQQDFNTDDAANWTVNPHPLTDFTVDFFHDYSGIGVPPAPGGTGTRGLKMTANNSSGVFGGFSVSPAGLNLRGDYTLSFDWWANYVGPLGPGGNGSTQLSTFGIGTAGNVAVWPGAATKESVFFGSTLDGNSASDFRAYSSVAPVMYAAGNAVYHAPGGGLNHSDPYYAVFTSATAPAAQLGLFPGQTGATKPGEASFRWVKVVIDVRSGRATWSLNGVKIATVDLSTVTLGGGNIFFGHSDVNASASTAANDTLLNVTLIDNVEVSRPPLRLIVTRNGSSLHFAWNGSSGKLYDLLSATDLVTPVSSWAIWNGHQDLAADELTVPHPAEPRRFFALREKDAP